MRLTLVIASQTAGGIGPVCRYAAEGIARQTSWAVTLLSLHDPAGESSDADTGLQTVCLGLDGNCARSFLEWIAMNPQDVIITSDVSRIEGAFPFLPPRTRHIVQVHDSGRRYRDVAVRHSQWIDGVACVARHIEGRLKKSLDRVGFKGLLRTIHNGANFPPLKQRANHDGPLRLLYIGRVEPLKGVFDLVPLLAQFRRMQVPVVLNIVGGENEDLRHQFARKGLEPFVTWTGRVPHSKCYEIAADSDILLMLSRKEPFGMVTIEAMSMGCVPIAYDIPSGTTEIIEHGRSGLLVPLGDVKSCAEQICLLQREFPRLNGLSTGAIERARTCFNVEKMAVDLSVFITDTMKNAAIRPSTREQGVPPEFPVVYRERAHGYQRLPANIRAWIRNRVAASPKICHLLLKRY